MITFQESSTTRRSPSCFREVTDSSQGLPLFCPPASSKEGEYHILKFYSLSSMIVNAALNNTSVEVDFPFRVTDLEHAIINLQPKPPSSIILLGRSGTGEYRIGFKDYFQLCWHMCGAGAAHLHLSYVDFQSVFDWDH